MIRNAKISRWAGWGHEAHAVRLAERPRLLAYLTKQLGGMSSIVEAVPLERLSLDAGRLSEQERDSLRRVVGSQDVDFSAGDRAIHSLGKSYRDMIEARSGRLRHVTDAVVYPREERQIAELLAWAVREDCAIVPFGGGTSVVGGVEPCAGRHHATITLDLMNLAEKSLDDVSQLADIGAGAFGPDVERWLNDQGFSLGHFPQSFEFSTLGGWVATRSAGQQSTLYGKIEHMVEAVRVATPVGLIETRRVPASATGPSIVQCLTGSEGTLGVITRCTMRVRHRAPCGRFLSFLLPDWPTAIGFVRHVVQEDVYPSVVRLSDPQETQWLMDAGSEAGGLAKQLGRALVKRLAGWNGFDGDRMCLCILGLEGATDTVALLGERLKALAGASRALSLGSSPGESWKRDRFRLPYLRDELMARGIMVDTLETATTWTNLIRLYEEVKSRIRAALADQGTPGVVMTHVSHVYPTGASLYYTFLARQRPGNEIEQWESVKRAATRAIVDGGGTLSHHHGIGSEHRPLEAEHGSVAVGALRSLKAFLDPADVMNPGKLL